MLEMTIDKICVIPGDHHWVAILKENDNDLYLAIFMCPGEAQVIVLKLQGVGTVRPSTHDLLGTVINTLGGSVKHE
jgi:bifunctional DNase/RNase